MVKTFFMGDFKGQMKIQQMAFMVLAVFIFFVLVGLFFLRVQFNNLNENFENLQREQTISSLQVISNMPELNCDSRTSMCLDLDKLKVMSGGMGEDYKELWPVASIKVYMVYPSFNSEIKCPAQNCNYYELYDNGQSNTQEYSTFASVCERINEVGYVYDKCEIGKLVVGVVMRDG